MIAQEVVVATGPRRRLRVQQGTDAGCGDRDRTAPVLARPPPSPLHRRSRSSSPPPDVASDRPSAAAAAAAKSLPPPTTRADARRFLRACGSTKRTWRAEDLCSRPPTAASVRDDGRAHQKFPVGGGQGRRCAAMISGAPRRAQERPLEQRRARGDASAPSRRRLTRKLRRAGFEESADERRAAHAEDATGGAASARRGG